MPLVKSVPIQKFFKGVLTPVSEQIICSDPDYVTGPEGFLVVKEIPLCKIKLSSQRSEHITIKAMTSVIIIPDFGLIDDEWEEISLQKGASIELYFCLGSWYIMSSDGLKSDHT